MVRNSKQSSYKSSGKNRQKKVKYRHDIALSSPGTSGVEIQLPALPQFKIGWRFLSFAIISVLVFMIYYVWNLSLFQVSSVKVEGALQLTAQEIISGLNVVGKPIFILDPDKMQLALSRSFDQLTDISVRLEFPAQVMVDVIERVPMISWFYDDQILWIDGNGFIYQPQGNADNLVSINADTLPPTEISYQSNTEVGEELTGELGLISVDLLEAIFSLKTHAPEDATLIYNSYHGLGWRDSKGWDVYYGTDLSDIESKFLVYQSVINRLRSDGVKPALINIEYVQSPYYRMEQ